jgi:hypothetical protein
MNFARFRQPALSAVAVLVISGAGIAFAGNSGSAPPAAGAGVAQAASSTATPTEDPAAEPVGGVDTDTLQEGDQTTPDTAVVAAGGATAAGVAGSTTDAAGTGAEAAGSGAEAAGTETEAAGVEEPGDANLPGGGHADDPNDPNADHQFEGVE